MTGPWVQPHPTQPCFWTDTGQTWTPKPNWAAAHLGVAGLESSYKGPSWSGPTRSGQAEGQAEPRLLVIQVTPGQRTILMTPGGKGGWSRGRAGPGWEGIVVSVRERPSFTSFPEQGQCEAKKGPAAQSSGPRLHS